MSAVTFGERMRTRSARTVLALGVVAAVGFSLGACSGSSGGSSSSGSGGGSVDAVDETTTIIDQFSGTFTMQNVFRGDKECLDANYLDPETDHGGAYMAPCNDQEDQQWQFTAVEADVYQIWTEVDGDRVCLDGNDKDSVVRSGAAFVEPCREIADQLWTVTAVDDNVRLHTEFREQAACLEGNEPGSTEHSGAAFMDTCQDATGQLWKRFVADS